ncbi:CHAT domain-containing protein [Nostocaceae cyanobacterium CENA369]|uniref:CHAT domain-containing protein n=1 Tax=Dendronalium phyllosphericum CENA369 TaxID=1725256 RepID=A0A8J7LDJ2_9NOST|nr:CHAT domain-containing protein [Dendronalium phyllosphericum]MBH8572053.1 CHAT domain-containing protein [Dendronalium phyllosphericum CENA369]
MNSTAQIKILFLAADPTDAARLRLGQELREIRERLQLAKERDKFVLESRESVRPGDISQAIFDVEPQIVHFSGHGTGTGELCFEDLLGNYQPVQPEALAALFELVADRINCVVLNACDSAAQTKAIAEHIPFVIGMNQAIGDQAAIAFVVGFYKALAAGQTIDRAYKFGCVEIRLQGISEHLTPVLYAEQSPVSPASEVQQINSNKSMTSLNLGQKRRILQEIESLQQQYDLLSQKLSRLRSALAIESGTAVKFQLEKQIENAEAEITQLNQRIEQLENSLQ